MSIGAGSCGKAARQMRATTVEHARRLVHSIGCPRALQYVIQSLATSDMAHRRHGILVAHVDHVIRSQRAADQQAIVPGPRENHR